MKNILCINGAGMPSRSATCLAHALTTVLATHPVRVQLVTMPELGLPFFDAMPAEPPLPVQNWLALAAEADLYLAYSALSR
jgi:hypothetical protein